MIGLLIFWRNESLPDILALWQFRVCCDQRNSETSNYHPDANRVSRSGRFAGSVPSRGSAPGGRTGRMAVVSQRSGKSVGWWTPFLFEDWIMEKCANCGREIHRHETVHVYHDAPACTQCYYQLSSKTSVNIKALVGVGLALFVTLLVFSVLFLRKPTIAPPSPSIKSGPNEQLAELKAANAELAKKVSDLSAQVLAQKSVATPPPEQSEGLDPDAFAKFAKSFAAILTEEEKGKEPYKDEPGEKTEWHHTYLANGTDIKKTDSLIDPVVGVIELYELEISETKRTDDNSLLSNTDISTHHTVTMSHKTGRWLPIRDDTKIEEYREFPDTGSTTSKVGQVGTGEGKWMLPAAWEASKQ